MLESEPNVVCAGCMYRVLGLWGHGFKFYVTQWVVSAFLGKSITKVYGSTLLALRGGGWESNFKEKSIMYGNT